MSDKPQTIQEMGEEFMTFLGLTITKWASIEEQMFLACRDILGATTQHIAIIYYKTPTINARLALLGELMETVFPKPKSGKHRHDDYKAWEGLTKLIMKELPVRNQLAHSPVAPFRIKEGGSYKSIQFQSYQHPHEVAWGKENKQPLNVTHLRARLPALSAIHQGLQSFRQDKLKAHIAKHFPQNINILTGSS